jgi:hypothetical protein
MACAASRTDLMDSVGNVAAASSSSVAVQCGLPRVVAAWGSRHRASAHSATSFGSTLTGGSLRACPATKASPACSTALSASGHALLGTHPGGAPWNSDVSSCSGAPQMAARSWSVGTRSSGPMSGVSMI